MPASRSQAMTMDTDTRLRRAVERVRRGQGEAFTEIVQQTEAELRSWLRLRCPSGVETEEILQRTYIAAYHRLARYQPATGSLVAWLTGIARRELAEELRRAARRARRERRFVDGLLLDSHLAEPDDRATARLHHLRRCLEGMDADRRALLQWRYGDHTSTAQIAARTQTAPGTVKKRLHLAREWLRRCIRKRERQKREDGR